MILPNSNGTTNLVWVNEIGTQASTQNSKSQHPTKRPVEGGTQRHRKAHKKVRTGCLTCKIRRKKCDEAKPVCARCSSIGIKCEGYAPIRSVISENWNSRTNLSASTLSSSASSPASRLSDSMNLEEVIELENRRKELLTAMSTTACPPIRSPNSFNALGQVSDLERHCFGYFRHRTGPQVASYFESLVWWLDGTRCLANSALFSAAVALGAVHRRMSYGISREAFEYCEYATRLFSIAKSRASELRLRLTGTKSLQDSEAYVKCELLLAMFQAFQDDGVASSAHLITGMQHLFHGRRMRLRRTETRYCMAKSRPRVFCRLYYCIFRKATEIFNTPINIVSTNMENMPNPPQDFKSLDQARDYIFSEVRWLMNSPVRWFDTDFRMRAQSVQFTRLSKWAEGYKRLVQTLVHTPQERKACALLRLTHNALYLLSFLTIRTDLNGYPPNIVPDIEEGDADDQYETDKIGQFAKALYQAAKTPSMLCNNLAKIKVMIRAMCEDSEAWNAELPLSPWSASVASSPAPSCASNSTMESRSYEDRATEVGVFTVAEQIHVRGEAAIFDAIRDILPSNVDIECVDTEFMLREQRLLLRYYMADEDGPGYWWMEELWDFGDGENDLPGGDGGALTSSTDLCPVIREPTDFTSDLRNLIRTYGTAFKCPPVFGPARLAG